MAYYHILGRNVHMLELLTGLSVMASGARHGGDATSRLRGLHYPSVSCTGAILQKFRVDSPYAAAHYLPGQLRLNGLPPWEYLSDRWSRIFLQDLFADVEKLHELFNKADSAAEQGPEGLKELAAHCAAHVLNDPAPPDDGRANRELVHNVFERLWLPGMGAALEAAIESKEEKPQPPPLQFEDDPVQGRVITNLEERSEAGPYEWGIAETITILQEYRACADARPGSAETMETFQQVDAKVRTS
jgi:hypothetical protein